MFASDRFLCLDVGASKLVLAEFNVNPSGGAPTLVRYGIGPLEIEGNSEADASAYIVSAIRDLMREHGIKPGPMLMALSGQAVFPRYVKLPPVSRDKIEQMVRYEAEQNVPFPINEVVWDYQLIEDDVSGELNVMLVAVKIENVKQITDCVQAADLEPEVVDVAPMALYNSVRYNYPDMDRCAMVLDIGARSSNLIFIEDKRIFSRSIPVAGNAITTEIAKEFDISFADAEELKREHAFVAFGGVYAGADNETADRISKIVRNVITRLHAEVNRSINFYRSQQGGSPPQLVLLAGGGSIIPHTDTFFREKLKVDVDYLNPFQTIEVGPAIDADQINGDFHLLGEVTGLALRHTLKCPVEINLMPPDILAKKAFRRRQPYFALSGVALMLTLLCWGIYFHQMRKTVEGKRELVYGSIGHLSSLEGDLKRVSQEKETKLETFNALLQVAQTRTQWPAILESIYEEFSEGMWLTSFNPVVSGNLVTGVEFSGRGFVDKLQDTASISVVEDLKNRLAEKDLFTEQSRIVREPPVLPGVAVREFTIRLALQNPIRIN